MSNRALFDLCWGFLSLCASFIFSINSEYMYVFQISVGGKKKDVYIRVITELKIIGLDGEMLSETVKADKELVNRSHTDFNRMVVLIR